MALSYQQGEYTLPEGVSSVTVVFPEGFSAKPAAVLPIMANEGPALLEGEEKLLLDLILESWSATEFTVSLPTSTNRPDYKIIWVAGDFSSVFSVVAQARKLSQLPRRTKPVTASDLVMVISTEGAPKTETMAIEQFTATTVTLVSPPTSQVSAGGRNQVAVDDTYFHTFYNGNWKKTRRDGQTVLQALAWRSISVNGAVYAGDRVLADTTDTPLALSLPLLPQIGDEIVFAPTFNTWTENALTVTRNGQLVEGLSEDLLCTTNDPFSLIFCGGTRGWKIIAP